MTSALILAAGKATRLVGLRDQYAKANVPIAGTTPLRFLLEAMGSKFEDVWINLHHKDNQVREEARRWADPTVNLHFLEEPLLLGTGGTLLEMAKRSSSLPTLIVNAKMFTDFDFGSLVNAEEGTLILHPPSSLQLFGGLRFDLDGHALGLLPKGDMPTLGEDAAVFTGICRPHQTWLPHLQEARDRNPNSALCLIRDGWLPQLRVDPKHSTAWLHKGFWCEISTPERVIEAQALLLEFP